MTRRILINTRLALCMAAIASIARHAPVEQDVKMAEFPAEPRPFKSKPRKDWEQRQASRRHKPR